MKKEIMVALIVASFLVVAIPFAELTDDSDAATTSGHGTYSIYTYYGGTWISESVTSAYDAAQAVTEMNAWQSMTDVMTPLYTTSGGNVTYQLEDYGDITTFRGHSASGDDVWNVFVYVSGSWIVPSPSLGCYTCFSDYNSTYQSANILLYYGDATTTAPAIPVAQTTAVPNSSITTVSSTSDYQYTFYLEVVYDPSYQPAINGTYYDINGKLLVVDVTDANTQVSIYDGVFVHAYGSNAALALDSLLNSVDFSMETSVPGLYNPGGDYYTYQGWMYYMFDLSTEQIEGLDTPDDWTDDSYAYWNIYDTHTAFSETNHLADFVLGGYSGMSCAPNADCDFALVYEVFSF